MLKGKDRPITESSGAVCAEPREVLLQAVLKGSEVHVAESVLYLILFPSDFRHH